MKILTLREFLEELNTLIKENPDRLEYKVLAGGTYPYIEVQDGDGSGEYDKRILIGMRRWRNESYTLTAR